MPGFPIRTSSDPRSVGSSPRHIAASYVLHRLSMPRHPPCALKHLQITKTKKQKLQKQTRHKPCLLDARNHYPQNKHHTPPPRWSDNTPTPQRSENRPVASGPNSVPNKRRPTPPLKEAVPVGDLSKPVVVVKLSAPPTTHYRRRRKISQPSNPTLFAGTGEKWCSLERR